MNRPDKSLKFLDKQVLEVESNRFPSYPTVSLVEKKNRGLFFFFAPEIALGSRM